MPYSTSEAMADLESRAANRQPSLGLPLTPSEELSPLAFEIEEMPQRGQTDVPDRSPQIAAELEQRHMARQADKGLEPTPITPEELEEATRNELLDRGYRPARSTAVPVDLRGAAPNVRGMRENLGLPPAKQPPEAVYAPRSPFAEASEETIPGIGYFADRYELYARDPMAAAQMHVDYEQLLRNSDGSSVVAQSMGLQGVSSPPRDDDDDDDDSVAPTPRITLENPPKISPKMDAGEIASVGNLSQRDRDRLNAIAVTEGKLRDQDAVAWAYPIYMVDESAIMSQGLPWEAVNSAIFRSSKLGRKEMAQVGRALAGMPVPDAVRVKAPWAETWADMIAVNEPADGSGGISLTLVASDVQPKDYQNAVRELRKQFPAWPASRGLRTEWGRSDVGYIENRKFDSTLLKLPADLQERVQQTYDTLRPYTEQIGSYHDTLRRGASDGLPGQIPEAE